MKTTKQVSLPEDWLEQLNLSKEDTYLLKKQQHKLVIESTNKPLESQQISLRWFILPVLITSLIFFMTFYETGRYKVPMNGDKSIASMIILLGLTSGMISFSFFFIKMKRRTDNDELRKIHWRNVPTIIFSFVVILLLVLLGFFWVLGTVFEGASFDYYTATAIFAVFMAIINYVMIIAALSFSSDMIIKLLITVIISGVFFAMITNSQTRWWQHNFSYLGTNEASSSWQFNLTLMLSAFLMIALIDYLFESLKHTEHDSLKLLILRILLTLMAISLAGVGFFPNNGRGQLHLLHTKSATWLVYLIVILIIGIKWLLPKVTKEFLFFSYSMAIILVIANVLFQTIGYLSLTAFELIAFALAFSWLLLLLQNIQKLSSDSPHQFYITFEAEKNEANP